MMKNSKIKIAFIAMVILTFSISFIIFSLWINYDGLWANILISAIISFGVLLGVNFTFRKTLKKINPNVKHEKM